LRLIAGPGAVPAADRLSVAVRTERLALISAEVRSGAGGGEPLGMLGSRPGPGVDLGYRTGGNLARMRPGAWYAMRPEIDAGTVRVGEVAFARRAVAETRP
jgi:hypothetical protein